jgi:large subunit ribosomal protein L23
MLKMMPEDIIVKPIITEKSSSGITEGKYTFKVAKNATKVQIANAVEALFNVKVTNVNTITVKGKEKRVGANTGKRPDWKKAIVTIDTNPTEKTYLTKGAKEVKVDKKYKDSIDEFMGA